MSPLQCLRNDPAAHPSVEPCLCPVVMGLSGCNISYEPTTEGEGIFIAGEATADAHYGIAHGAWMEGERAAEQALAALVV